MSEPNYALQAEAIVLTNDLADIHARIAAQEHQLEHGEYPPPWQLDVWANDFRDEHEREVNELAQVLKADHEFKVLTDSFSEEEYDEDEGEGEFFTIDQYCELCHDDPDGCGACRDS